MGRHDRVDVFGFLLEVVLAKRLGDRGFYNNGFRDFCGSSFGICGSSDSSKKVL